MRVRLNSSATILEKAVRPLTFATHADLVNSRATGGHLLSNHPRASHRWTLPAGLFSFAPHGEPVTFQRVLRLPKAQSDLSRQLARLLSGGDASLVLPAALRLREYGFLLGTAPLNRAVRKAILEAIASLPGIKLCTAKFAKQRAKDDGFCVDGDPSSTEVLIDSHTGVAVVVRERLTKVTPLYPHMRVGALVDSDSFSRPRPRSAGAR